MPGGMDGTGALSRRDPWGERVGRNQQAGVTVECEDDLIRTQKVARCMQTDAS